MLDNMPDFLNKNSPFYISEKVSCFLNEIELCVDLMSPNAESVIKSKKDKYLIKRPDKVESQDAYSKRLESAVLVNAYQDWINLISGMVCAAGISVSDEAQTEEVLNVLNNPNLEGDTKETFASSLFRAGLGSGCAAVVIDAPEKNEYMTVYESKEAGVRPWMYIIKSNQLLGWKEKNGILTNVRFFYNEHADDFGFSERIIWYAVEYSIKNGVVFFKKWKFDNNELSNPIEKEIKINKIPVVPFTPGESNGYMLSYPPALRLAILTKAYYNSWSLQQNFGVIARTPLLTVIGAAVREVLHSLSSVFSLDKPKQEVSVGYVEPGIAGAEFGWKELEKIENIFRYWGVDIERQNANVLATVKIIDNSRIIDEVKVWAGELEKTLSRVMEIAMLFYGKKFARNGIVVGKEYGMPSLTQEQVQLINTAVASDGLSGKQVFDLVKVYIPQIGETTWENVLDSFIGINQTK